MKKQLRHRQEKVVNKALDILKHPTELTKKSIIIAPTGSGKTVMFCTLAKRAIVNGLAKKILILVHRTEIFYQNVNTFLECEGECDHSIFCQEEKNLTGQVVFAMVLTFNNVFKNDNTMLQEYDCVIVDEAHHTMAQSYRRMLESIRHDGVLFGFTATPRRGDGKKLTAQYTHVCDQIFMKELIDNGLLVPPVILQAIYNPEFLEKLENAKKKGGDYDLEECEKLLDDEIVHEEMYNIWCENASGRQTVVFCTTVNHARDVSDFFQCKGESADYIYGDMPHKNREEILRKYKEGEIQILVNVAILIEGWDDPHTSCVILLRPSSYLSVVMQMIGRGLRSLNEMALKAPHLNAEACLKVNCIVIDLGVSCTRLRSLEQFLDFGMTKADKKRLAEDEEAERRAEEARKRLERLKKAEERAEENRLNLIEKMKTTLLEKIRAALEHAVILQKSDENRAKVHWFQFVLDSYAIYVASTVKCSAACIFNTGDNTGDEASDEFEDFAFGIFKDKRNDPNLCDRTNFVFVGGIGAVRMALESLVLRAGGALAQDWHNHTVTEKQAFKLANLSPMSLEGKIVMHMRTLLIQEARQTKGSASAIIDLHYLLANTEIVVSCTEASTITTFEKFEIYNEFLHDVFSHFQKSREISCNHLRAVGENLLVVLG
jgi:superfamily II DNA or RNA helicase